MRMKLSTLQRIAFPELVSMQVKWPTKLAISPAYELGFRASSLGKELFEINPMHASMENDPI